MAASILPNQTVLAGPSAAIQAAPPHAVPPAGGFTELLADLHAVPAGTAATIAPAAKSATGTNDPSQAAGQPLQTNAAERLDSARIAGVVVAPKQSVAAPTASETTAREPVEHTVADTPSLPAPEATAPGARRAVPPKTSAQDAAGKDALASIERSAPAAVASAARDDRKPRTETAAQDQSKQDQTQSPLPPQPIVVTTTAAPPPASTTEASSNAPKLQVEAVVEPRASAANSADQRQQAEPLAVANGPTPAVVASAQQASQPIAPALATPEPPAPQRAVETAAETVTTRVVRAVQDGIRVLTMQLHPAELGRVEVRLSFHDGGIGVQMTLDRPETYDAFTRNRDAMEQQLANGGISLTTGGLDLRFGQQPDRSVPQPSMQAMRVAVSGDTASSPSPPPARSTLNGLIDILA